MIIYLITNRVNNKQYVGQTRSSLRKRFNQHCDIRNKTAISYAIRKYGKENFSIEALCENINNLDELNKLEIQYIKDLNTISPNGYNVESGGRCSSPSEETKRKISKANRGRKIIWTHKISGGVKKLWQDSEYREKQTKQRHEKRGKYREGIVREKLRKKIDLENFKIDYRNYMSLSDIQKKYEISLPTVYKIIEREQIEKRGHKCNNKNI